MKLDIRASFVGCIPRGGVSESVVIELLGEPEDVGRGGKKFRILAYCGKRLQVTFCEGRLWSIGFYFQQTKQRHSWPEGVNLSAELSGATREVDLLSWLEANGHHWRKMDLVSNVNYITEPYVAFVVADGYLESIQIPEDWTFEA